MLTSQVVKDFLLIKYSEDEFDIIFTLQQRQLEIFY